MTTEEIMNSGFKSLANIEKASQLADFEEDINKAYELGFKKVHDGRNSFIEWVAVNHLDIIKEFLGFQED